MFRTLTRFLAFATLTSALSAAGPHIVLVGDSTVNDGGGWGYGFRQFVTPDVVVTNTAENGRSSKSFRDEGHWATALAAKGDYYLIQFGHNDQPGKGPQRETDPATTYTENMARYVDELSLQPSYDNAKQLMEQRDKSGPMCLTGEKSHPDLPVGGCTLIMDIWIERDKQRHRRQWRGQVPACLDTPEIIQYV